MGEGLKVYLYSYYITSGLLIPIEAFTLYKVRGSYPFATRTLWLLIISNVAAILFAATNAAVAKKSTPVVMLALANSLATTAKDGCFNLGQWVFAF